MQKVNIEAFKVIGIAVRTSNQNGQSAQDIGQLWAKSQKLLNARPDADRVHADGFYFFDLSDHRTMILIVFAEGEATIVWCGDHDKYTTTFKNNKNTIKKWLREKNWI